MNKWNLNTIGKLSTSINSGFACSKSFVVEDGYVHLRTHNIDTNGNLNTDLFIKIDISKVDVKKSTLQQGDVLFNNTNSTELVGKTALIKHDYNYAFSNHLTKIKFDREQIIPAFAVYYLNKLWLDGYFARVCKKWNGQSGVNINILKEIKIPLPTPLEQEKIVSKLDTIFNKIDKAIVLLEENIANTQALMGSVLDEELMKYEVEESTVGQVIVSISSGFACNKSNEMVDGHVHLRTHNIDVSGNLNFDLIIKVNPDKIDIKKSQIEKDDILFNNTNSKELVGKTALVDKDYSYGYSNHLTKIKVNKEKVLPAYFVNYMVNLQSQGYFERICKKWIGQAGVNSGMLKETVIKYPKVQEQLEVIEKVKQIKLQTNSLIEAQYKKLNDLKALKSSLLDKAFKGEL